MRFSNFRFLVRRNMAARGGRMLSARLGVGFAVFMLTLGLGAATGIGRSIRPVLETLFPERRILVRPQAVNLALVRFQTGGITDATLDSLRAIPGVARVDPQMPVRFPVAGEGRLGPMSDELVTELVVHGVPRETVAGDIPRAEPWDWTFADARPCPVVISSYFLDMFNLGLAESTGLPKLNERALIGRGFTLLLGDSVIVPVAPGGKRRQVRCEVVGFTRDPYLAGVAMPLSAVRAFNEWYHESSAEARYTMARVETVSGGDLEAVAAAIRKQGVVAQVPGHALERWRWALRAAAGVVVGLGLGILLVALSNVVGAFTLVLVERREEIGLLQAFGAEPRLIRRLFLAEIAWIAFVSATTGALAATAVAWGATRLVAPWVGQLQMLGEFTLVPRPGAVAAVLVGVMGLSLSVVWPAVSRAVRLAPATLLRG